jgi:hypothetical protein
LPSGRSRPDWASAPHPASNAALSVTATAAAAGFLAPQRRVHIRIPASSSTGFRFTAMHLSTTSVF